MQTYAFLDLDDTIFQTRGKCPPEEASSLETGAFDRDGVPLSFMSARQRQLFDWLSASATVIPVTARSLSAFRRVALPFHHAAILDFGGVVLLPDGQLDEEWDRQMRPALLPLGDELAQIQADWQADSDVRSLGVRVRVISDFDLPLYVVAKHVDGNTDALRELLKKHVSRICQDRFGIHLNDNNLSVVPRCLGKERAVEYVLKKYAGGEPVLTLGLGDSLSDAPFLAACDFAVLPRQSQLLRAIQAGKEFFGTGASTTVVANQARNVDADAGSILHVATAIDAPVFSGSYDPDDVIFLLKPVRLEPTPVAEKERLIQSGTRHYSEMLSPETPPSEEYLRLFHEALSRHQTRFAQDLIRLARRIAERQPGPITLVSLARAGTPIGALLKRVLQRWLDRPASHYSISLIRDRGIDTVALRFLLQSHSPQSIVFIDGWTGKGVMSRELHTAVKSFQHSDGVELNAGLHVIADLSGTGAEAATAEDYLIPCSLLGATISGLVSRSILNAEVVGPQDFHGCVQESEFAAHDLSRWFLDVMTAEIERQWPNRDSLGPVLTDVERLRQRSLSAQLLVDVAGQFGVRDPNHVKPGIGEATRVLLRRVPSHLLLRSKDSADLRHLRELAERRSVPVLIDSRLPYHAVALIRDLGKGDA